MSVLQGERLSALLEERKQAWNRDWNGQPIVADGPLIPKTTLASGLTLTVLSPSTARLEELEKHWIKELSRRGFSPGEVPVRERRSPTKEKPASDEEDSADESQERRPDEKRPGSGRDPLAGRAIEELATGIGDKDEHVHNGSSIALLAEFHGMAVLSSGDAFARDLERAVRQLLKERSIDRLPLDAFVVPHMGSRNNMTISLLELLDCHDYLFSSDGRRFGHPHPETVAAVLKHGRRSSDEHITLVFNYRSEINAVWDSPKLQDGYNYTARYPDSGMSGIRVELGGSRRDLRAD